MASRRNIEHGVNGTPSRDRAQVLYDGLCPLCLKSVALLKRLDWRHCLAFVNARALSDLPVLDPPLDPVRLLQEMHLVPGGSHEVYRGFTAFRWIAWRLPALWPVVPFLYLPGMTALGTRAYLWVARNRFRLVPCHGGVCSLPGTPRGPAGSSRS